MEKVALRTDLNEMVASIGLKVLKTKYSERPVCQVTLFNGVVVNFKDENGLCDLVSMYRRLGHDISEVVKSKKLIEDYSTGTLDEDNKDGKYFCVVYELKDGDKFHLFPDRKFVDKKILNLNYEAWKQAKKEQKAQGK